MNFAIHPNQNLLIHKDLGQNEESIFCFEKVLTIEPDNDQAKVNLEELRTD